MNQPSAPLPILDGKYQLVRQLGEGGMGAVYEARHTGTGRRCAVKVIASEALAKNADVVSRFRREAMASGAIESQYIANVLDTGVDAASGSPYLVMELLVGEDVHEAIARLGALRPELALRICAQACLGLQKAHEAGIVHRDIKPANLFLAQRDAGEAVVKLLDFGIAKVKMENMSVEAGAGALTRTGTMLGSPLYMSPEQALGKKSIDHRTDVWSLGVVLYEMLTGVTPAAEATTIGALIMMICSQPPRLVQEHAPWVPREVAAIVHKALAMEPDARFRTAGEMFAAIHALLPGGFGLNASMFEPIGADTKSVRAIRFAVPADAVRPPAPSLGSLPEPPADPDEKVRPTTTAGFGHSWKPPAPERRSRAGPAMALGGLGLVVAAGAFFAVSRLLFAPAATNAVTTPVVTAPVDPPATAAPAPTAPDMPVLEAALAAPATAAAPVAAAPAAPVAVVPAKVAAPPPRPSPRPAAPPAAAAPPASAPPSKPKASCDPPYTIDGNGNKHFRPECF